MFISTVFNLITFRTDKRRDEQWPMFPSCYTCYMSVVKPVFTEYEQEIVREIAVHRVQPNAVQRLLDTVGKPVGKILKYARESSNPALRGISDRVQGWVQEGLIKTIK